MVHVVRLVSVVSLWLQSVCPLMPSLSTSIAVKTSSKQVGGDYVVSEWSEIIELYTADYSKFHLTQLLEKAEVIVGQMLKFSVFYHNKHKEYFDYIQKHHRNALQPSVKSNSGSHGSSMSGKLEGIFSWASVVAQLVKNLPAMQETWVQSLDWDGTIPWRRERLPTPVFWPGEFHGDSMENSMGRSPWGRKESDMTEDFHFHFLKLRH